MDDGRAGLNKGTSIGTVLLICDVLSSRHSSSTGRMTFCFLVGWPLGTSHV